MSVKTIDKTRASKQHRVFDTYLQLQASMKTSATFTKSIIYFQLTDHSALIALSLYLITILLISSTELRAFPQKTTHFSVISLNRNSQTFEQQLQKQSVLAIPDKDGIVKTSVGEFIVKGRGEYYFNDGKHILRINEKDAPPEVKAYAEKNFPANGEVVSDGRRYKMNSDGSLLIYVDKLNIWGAIPENEISSLPDDVQKYYYENKSTYDSILMYKIFQSPMWGNITPTEAQIAEQEKIILKISASKGKIPSNVYDWTKDPQQLRAAALA